MNVMVSLYNPKVAKQLRNLNGNETLLSSESNIQSSRVHSPGAATGVKRPRLDNLETALKIRLKLGLRRRLDKDSGCASSTVWSPKTVLYMDDVKLPVFLEGSYDFGSSDAEEELKRVRGPKSDDLESELETHKESSVPLTKKVLCSHSTGIVRGMCVLCRQIMNKETGVKFECIQKESRLFDEQFVRLCIREKNRLVSRKKLCLVLDLDHTLLHTSKIVDMKPKEESCEGLFKFDSLKIMTKLRPFVHDFLREASEMFEMYIYTMGNNFYALEMAKLLDPNDDYFTGRIISREDSTQEHQKSLNMVPVHESAVLILDDKEMVWTKHKDNLILMKEYNFFPPKGNQVGFNFKSLSEQNADESKSGGVLSTVLKVLKQIHSLYFEQVVVANNLDERDVREVLKGVRKVVLKDCRLVFSQVSSTKVQFNEHSLWTMAEQMGALRFTKVDERATHVISTSSGTKESRWALKEKKFLVHPMWIEAAYYFWQRQPEEEFCISKPKRWCNPQHMCKAVGRSVGQLSFCM